MRLFRAVVRVELQDQLRDRAAMFARVAPTLLLIAGLVITAALIATGDTADDDRPEYDVGLEATPALTESVASRLAPYGITVVDLVPDALESGAIDLVIDVDETTFDPDDATPTLQLTRRPADQRSARAERAVRAAVTSIRSTDAFVVDEVEVEPSLGSVRRVLGFLLGSALLLILQPVLGTTMTSVIGGQQRGVLAHQLSLPIPRRTMLLAKATAETTLTLIASSVILLPVLVAAVAVTALDGGVGRGALAALASLVMVATVAIAFGAGGFVLAARRTDAEDEGLWSMLGMVVAVATVFIADATATDTPTGLYAAPIIGLALALRTIVVGDPWVIPFALGATSAFAVAGVVVVFAGRVDTQRLGMRGR